MICVGKATSGGEQWPMRILSKAVIVIPVVSLFLCILSIFLYKSWSKKYWYILALLTFLFSIPIFIYFS
jgi:hypothetical protein